MTKQEAIALIKDHIPNGEIQKICAYKYLYLAVVFTPDPYEGDIDAIYFVNRATGEFGVFSYLEENVFSDVIKLLKGAPKYISVRRG